MLQRLRRSIAYRRKIRREASLIRNSGLFDGAWYLLQNPDVAAAGIDPLVHYLHAGASEGRSPHPSFDVASYLSMNPDVAAAGTNPLAHFLCSGKNREPIPIETETSLLNSVSANHSQGFVDAEFKLSEFRRIARDDVSAGRPTWLATDFEIVNIDGVFRRTYKLGLQPGETPTPEWPLDPETAPNFVIPFVALETNVHSLSVSVAGGLAAATTITMRLATSPDGAAVIDGNAIYDPRTSQVIWTLGGGVLQRGQRYFLHIDVDRPSGLTLRAGLFDGGAHGCRKLINVGLDAEMALPSQWPQSSWQVPSVTFILSADSAVAQTVTELARNLFPESDIQVIHSERDDAAAIDLLGRSRMVVIDVTLLGGRAIGMSVPDLVRFLSIHGTTLVYLQSGSGSDLAEISVHDVLKATLRHFSKALVLNERLSSPTLGPLGLQMDTAVAAQALSQDQPKLEWIQIPSSSLPKPFDGQLPHVAIVTILYGKSGSLPAFLEAVYRQSYSGPITIVLVNDHSPNGSLEFETLIEESLERKPAHIGVKLVNNDANLGNCRSRNIGIEATEADICVVIDSDCLINGHFVRAHVAEHILASPDAVVGPYNIETNGEDGSRLVRSLENEPAIVKVRAEMQDPLLNAAFVNTVTRNFSISRRWYDAHGGFDPILSYSAHPDTGYGWEDVEIGARIYAKGGTIRYTPHAFSVHLSHGSSMSQGDQAKASAKNFVRLLKKHNFIKTAARRWYVLTADRIVRWAQGVGVNSPDIEYLNADLENGSKQNVAPLLPYLRREKRRYKVLTHRWHVPHQYEIYKLPIDFVLVTGTGTPMTYQWSSNQRPLPSNVQIKSVDEIDFSEFDMAIVHFDENVLCTDLSNGVLGHDWGLTFRWFLANVKLPMVGVCHGTPPFVGQYGANPDPIDRFTICDADAEYLRRALWDVRVVVNSHQAASEWRFNKTKVIWHGYDPQEFPFGRHDLDVVSHGVDLYRPHYRGAHQLKAVLERLDPSLSVSTHRHLSDVPVPSQDRRFSEFNFRNWLAHLGRHKVYLNTTLRSPMPRSRTEAMMCGAVPISLDNHDVSQFIRNDVNGFSSESIEEISDYCNYLCRNSGVQQRVSAAARQTAIDLFNHDHFLSNWASLVDDTVGR